MYVCKKLLTGSPPDQRVICCVAATVKSRDWLKLCGQNESVTLHAAVLTARLLYLTATCSRGVSGTMDVSVMVTMLLSYGPNRFGCSAWSSFFSFWYPLFVIFSL